MGNSEEMSYRFLLGPNEPTPENFEQVVQDLYITGALGYNRPIDLHMASSSLKRSSITSQVLSIRKVGRSARL